MEKERQKNTKTKKAILSRTLSGSAEVFRRGGVRMVRTAAAIWRAWVRRSEDKSSHGKMLLRMLLSFGAVFAVSVTVSLAAFPFSVYPAGFAILAALGGSVGYRRTRKENGTILDRAWMLTAFSGVLFSTAFLGGRALFYLIAYLILFLLRAHITGGAFDDSLLGRVTLASAVSTGLGLLFAFFDGFPMNAVFGAVCMGLLTPILAYLLSGFYVYSAVEPSGGETAQKRKIYLASCVFTLFFLFLFSLKGVQLFGISIPFVLAVCAALLTAKRSGALLGAAVGMIGGMACTSAAVAPALAVGGFFSGLFFEYSGAVALMIAFVSSCGYSFFTEGVSSFSAFAWDYLAALVLVFPLQSLLSEERATPVKSAPREAIHRETMRRTREKLRHMSDAFSSLSEVFYTVSDTMKKPGLTESSRLISDCCSAICSRCALSGICWGQDPALSATVTTSIASRLMGEGKITEQAFSAPFSSGCKHRGELVEMINRRWAEISGADICNHKTGMLAGEYSSVSRLLQSTAGELDRELEYNPAMEQKAKKVLEELGLAHRRVAVFGSREMRIDVYGVALERVSLAAQRILSAFEDAFDFSFEGPDFLMFEESVVMRLRRKRRLALECAKSGCTKKGESVSGDSCRFFETDREYFYTLICDGMGSGREAAFTSRLSSIFIEKLMHCATPKNVTLEMLNTFLMAKTDETFTTVDLLEVDLLSGDANFIKAGAAPSFVLRGDRLHRIESRTPPAGALHRMCAEQTTFPLREGDFVILMSDGAETAEEGSGWLIRLLSGTSFDHAGALCDHIFRCAREKGAFRDDLSISVIRIMNAK